MPQRSTPIPASAAARPLGWPEIRQHAIDGLRASIDFLAQQVEITQVTDQVLPVPERRLLYVTTRTSPPGGWGRRSFVLTDADTRNGRNPRRVPVLPAYDPQAHRIVLDVTPAVRHSLGGATRVEIGYTDNIKITLKRALLAQLEQSANSGPMVADLWKRTPLISTVGAAALNKHQQTALAAMVNGGGWLVWGPPGTGKTKVIVEAVRHALASGRTVLISSHTHVAVDNVIKDLALIEQINREPGVVIRVPPTESSKLDPEVTEHPWLLIDKAAAVITRRTDRLLELEAAEALNRTHQDRSDMVDLVERLIDVDSEQIEQAVRAHQAAAALPSLVAEREAVQRQLSTARAQLTRCRLEIDSAEAQAGNVRHAIRAAEEAERESEQWHRAAALATQQNDDLASAMRTAQVEHQELHSQLTDRPPRLPWRRKALSAAEQQAAVRFAEITQAEQRSNGVARNYRASSQSALNRAVESRRRAQAAAAAAQRAYELKCEVAELISTVNQQGEDLSAVTDRLTELTATAAAVNEADRIVANAEEKGIFALLEQREDLNKRVHRLNLALAELDLQRSRLQDEYAATKRQLLATAPVVGCTLSKLTTNTELANRRFDIVIVDEAASAEVPQLVYAGSKADHGLALVGDFLQNAPITDVDDAVTNEARATLPWQRDDIFALLGITDRAAADAHPRCVPLRMQYRYPSVIASIVNEFCYDGLLESHRNSSPADGHTIIFVDTSGHPEEGLRPSGKSQTHPLGLRLLDPLIRQVGDGRRVGLVCPYRAQADRATRATRNYGTQVQSGTAHKFQGRQFPVVIVDLMQDASQPRWVAAADIRGNERAVSAAKLLNVAITRAQEQLVMIGDWSFVLSADSPGMRAIAHLSGLNNFQLVSATDVLLADGA